MQYNHELIVPNEDLPFKMFIFEGKEGNYKRETHWHRSVEIFAVCDDSDIVGCLDIGFVRCNC